MTSKLLMESPTFLPLPSDPNEPMTPAQLAAFGDALSGGDAFRRKIVELALQHTTEDEELSHAHKKD